MMTTKGAIPAVKRAIQRRRGENVRAQVVAAFRKIRNGIDDKVIYAQTKDWYRSSGGDWALGLS